MSSGTRPIVAGASPERAPVLCFTRKADDYAASRPDYPEALFQTLRERLPQMTDIADVGAGTGLLTAGLLRHGYRVNAVEPDTAMLAVAERLLGGRAGYRGYSGTAEAMPLADHSVDLVAAAQAFHWFDRARARTEFRRVLRPGGQVALIWNSRVDDDPLQLALNQVLQRFGIERRPALYRPDEVRDFLGEKRTVELCWPHAQALDAGGLERLVFSRSYIPLRESPEGREVTRMVRAVFGMHQCAGRVTVSYRTTLFLGGLD